MKRPRGDTNTGNLFGNDPEELAKAEGAPVQATILGTWERATTKRNEHTEEADRAREARAACPISYEPTRAQGGAR